MYFGRPESLRETASENNRIDVVKYINQVSKLSSNKTSFTYHNDGLGLYGEVTENKISTYM